MHTSILHVSPGRTLMFSFCWTKSVVSTAGNAVTLLHIAYLLTWLAISTSRFTRSFSYPLLRCYAVTHCLPGTWLSICTSRFTRSFSYPLLGCSYIKVVSRGHFRIRCYDVTLLRCLYISRFTGPFSYPLLRCYAVTLLRCYTLPIY